MTVTEITLSLALLIYALATEWQIRAQRRLINKLMREHRTI